MGRLFAMVMVAAVLVSGACATDRGPARRGEGPTVVTTVAPITNIVQNVGGERITLMGIVPEGTDSHTFEPAPSDARVLAQADIVFLNGLHLEEPTLRLAEANVGDDVPIVKLGERTISREEWIFDFSFPEDEGDPNPHLWTSPLHVKRYAAIVRDELKNLDADGAAAYDRNYAAFAARLDELDRLTRDATASVPENNRKLLTYHDSFPYFAKEYGWTVIGAIQPSDFSEPRARDIARLIGQIRREGIPAIFGSEVFPSPVLEQIARESGATYVDDLSDDELPGEVGSPEHSYLGMMVHNLRTMVGALGGDPAVFDGFDTSNVASGDTTVYR